ncbi:unnamed protein product [Dibothriocephalus latus]|uniref:Uncharacterized protein n=1 Tax=Dibothriocephalus latus TaxID=60516 RepID=A0A3P7NR25_DIBLA|nr:unnamed protein product [Dibothriocephalus latus]
MKERIFVIGGNYSTTIEEYLVRDRRWRKRAPFAVGRNNHAVAAVNVATSPDEEEEEGGTKKTLISIFGASGPVSSCAVFDTIQDR